MAEPITKQLTTFANKLNRTQKFTIAGVVIAAIAGMILLVSSTSQPAMSVLFSELDQKDAGVIVEKLKEKKIPFELQSNGTAIMVPANVLHETRLSLASEGLPQSSTVGYEIFDKTNLGMSDFVQKLNYRRALEGELARTIGSIDEVHKARVHIVVPEKALFDKDQKKATASVILQLKSGRNISKLNTDGIQNLVASSVEGMETSAVTVVDQKGQIISEPPRDKNSLVGLSSTQYELQQKVDQYLTAKVQSLLDGVLGVGNAVVRANAELDFTQVEKTTEDFDPDKQVVRSEQKIDEQSKTMDSLSTPPVNSASQRGNTVTNYEISKKVEKIVSQGGGIRRLSVATLINGTTKIKEGDKPVLEYKPRADDEMQKITQVVKNAVGYDPARNDQVSVVNVQFDPSQLEEDLKQRGLKLPMEPNEIIEKVLIVVAMLLAVWMIRKLVSSPQVRSRIEQVLGPPPQLEPMTIEAGGGSAAGGQLMLEDGTIQEKLPELAPPMSSRDLMRARARARLGNVQELTEEMMLKIEMQAQVMEHMVTQPDEAIRLIKLLLRQDGEETQKR